MANLSNCRLFCFKVCSLLIVNLLLSTMAYAKCIPYFAESLNGDGGFRFMHDVNNFKAISSGQRFDGEICDRNSIKIELAKRDLGTTIRFHINGKRYDFSSGQSGDKNANNWYRKYYDVKL